MCNALIPGSACSNHTACKHCHKANTVKGTAPPQQMCPECAAGPGWQVPWLQMLGQRGPAGKPCAGRGAWSLAPVRPHPLCSTRPVSPCRASRGLPEASSLSCRERQALLCVLAEHRSALSTSRFSLLFDNGQCCATRGMRISAFLICGMCNTRNSRLRHYLSLPYP